jgi:methionyl-tRNA formyltransferase
MKIVLLTTDTIHHRFIASCIHAVFSFHTIIVEKPLDPPYETHHPMDDLQERYERENLQPFCSPSYDDLTDTYCFHDIHEEACIRKIREVAPDVILICGTRIVPDKIISIPSIACLNLHGADPQEYRGIDSFLWAIYHNDFSNLIVALHKVDSHLDTGDIVLMAHIPITKDTRIYQIRAICADICVDLFRTCIMAQQTLGWIPSFQQRKKGRYYSYMPAALKETCQHHFDAYVNSLL